MVLTIFNTFAYFAMQCVLVEIPKYVNSGYMFGFACCCRLFGISIRLGSLFRIWDICLTIRIDSSFYIPNLQWTFEHGYQCYDFLVFVSSSFFLSLSVLALSLCLSFIYYMKKFFSLLIKYFCWETMKFVTEVKSTELLNSEMVIENKKRRYNVYASPIPWTPHRLKPKKFEISYSVLVLVFMFFSIHPMLLLLTTAVAAVAVDILMFHKVRNRLLLNSIIKFICLLLS